MVRRRVVGELAEAAAKYLGWEVYQHNGSR
jgi:hypothetical protein